MELFITRTWPEKNRLNVFSNSAIFGDFDQLPKSFQLLQAFKMQLFVHYCASAKHHFQNYRY